MKSKIITLVLLCSTIITLVGCSSDDFSTNNATKDRKLDSSVYEWIDEETVVHYVYNVSGAFSVRYNSDGTIMVEEN